MEFRVINVKSPQSTYTRRTAYLLEDAWDDWFKYSTQYFLFYIDSNGVKNDIGAVKIGQLNMSEGQRRPNLPTEFRQLEGAFFSIGQDESYYEELKRLGPSTRDEILLGLRDFARDISIYDNVKNEAVTYESLLRFVNEKTVTKQFHRMSLGGEKLTPYKFDYVFPKCENDSSSPVRLRFEVHIDTNPPTNIHVLVGRNGVGKTWVLRNLTLAHLQGEGGVIEHGMLAARNGEPAIDLFSSIVYVSFSAFDQLYVPIKKKSKHDSTYPYRHVGIANFSQTTGKSLPPKSPKALQAEFAESLKSCLEEPRWQRLRTALTTLETDQILSRVGIRDIFDMQNDSIKKEAAKIFAALSSGHKIIMLSLVKLIETVSERTLVLIDEPESHLHPPLLASYIKAISELLADRNGVCIVATHSPVVVQQVPKSCVWILNKYGSECCAERPQIETFGESIGALTSEIFEYEVKISGYHALLKEAVGRHTSYEELLSGFDNQLGAEAKAIAMAAYDRRMERKDD